MSFKSQSALLSWRRHSTCPGCRLPCPPQASSISTLSLLSESEFACSTLAYLRWVGGSGWGAECLCSEQTSDIQKCPRDCERIHCCCFKPSNLWSFVTAATGHSYVPGVISELTSTGRGRGPGLVGKKRLLSSLNSCPSSGCTGTLSTVYFLLINTFFG